MPRHCCANALTYILLPQYAIVLRDGEKQNLQAEDLSIGDVVEVKFGDRVPADIRVIEARGFKVSYSFVGYNHGGLIDGGAYTQSERSPSQYRT